LLLGAFLSSFCLRQDRIYTYTSDPLYPTMDVPITIYVNVLSEDILLPGQIIDTDSIVTAYTSLITSVSSNNTSSWQHIVNDGWSDISLEMTKENDSIYSFTIEDPVSFYDVNTTTEPVYRIAFIARGTSNGVVNQQTIDLFIDVFASEPPELISTQPLTPYATGSVVITFNSEACDSFTGYTDTLYAYTGLITTSSISDDDWKFILADWGENTYKTRLIQVSDSIYRFYEYPTIHHFYATGHSENIEKLAFIFRSKEDPYLESPVYYIDIMDTLTIENPNSDQISLPEASISMNINIFPIPTKDFIYIQPN